VVVVSWSVLLTKYSSGCLAKRGAVLPGVLGPSDTARAFGDLWCSKTGQDWVVGMEQRIHKLTQVRAVEMSAGRMIRAGTGHLGLATRWFREFARETGVSDVDPRHAAKRRIDRQRLYLWMHEEIVAMAGWSGTTRNGVRVNAVYTPPESRGLGYATSCVATLSRQILKSGREFCCLYTDLANPTSNAIYQRIGYEPVCDASALEFVGGGSGATNPL
jgi:predicted GNAT family acetyltransferase